MIWRGRLFFDGSFHQGVYYLLGGEVFADGLGGYFRSLPAEDNLAFFQDIGALAGSHGESDILLGQ